MQTRFRFTFLVLLIVSETCQWYGVLFYQFGKKYNAVENALFAAFYRWMFVLPYALLGLQHLSSDLGESKFTNAPCSQKESTVWIRA